MLSTLTGLPRVIAARFTLLAITAGLLCLAGTIVNAESAPTQVSTAITVVDDQRREVTLPGPARRAITAAPHATELIHAAGAGKFLVGTAQGSNTPAESSELPSIGNTLRPNLEIATVLQPDLLVAWQPSTPDPLGKLMQRLNVPIYYSDPRTLAEVADAVQAMGRLFGTEPHAEPVADALRARLAALSARYANSSPVRVFIQAGSQPLYTLNRNSIVSDALRLCGGVNVFGDLAQLAPQITLESVLAAQPDAVIAGVSSPDETKRLTRSWQQYGLRAANQGYVLGLDADALYRPGPRMIDVTEQLCREIDHVRQTH